MKIIVILTFILFGLQNLGAQTTSDSCDIMNILSRIGNRDTTVRDIKKKDVLIDTLYAQVNDYRNLVNILNQSVSVFDEENQTISRYLDIKNLLTSSDTIVFSKEFFDIVEIPVCLKQHAQIIKKIVQVKLKIEQVEYQIIDISKRLQGLNIDVKEAIRKSIEKEVFELDAMIGELVEMDLSTLSNVQKEYFRPRLTNRYNKFQIYFEK